MPTYGHNQKTKKQEGWDVKEARLREDTDPKQRVDLQVGDFDKLIEQKGVNVKIFRTVYCPNVKSVDGAEHEIDCPLCNGSGLLDGDHLCTKGFIQNQNIERLMDNQGGQLDGNTVMMTFPIGVELSYFTLIELIDFTQPYQERILRKVGTSVDILHYKACRVNLIVDKTGAKYYQEQDFSIDQNGNILWKTRKPADNMIYSIHYESHVQFRATRALHVARYTQYRPAGEALVEHIKMNEQWVCAKEFLVRRRDRNDNSDLLQGPYDVHANTTGNND